MITTTVIQRVSPFVTSRMRNNTQPLFKLRHKVKHNTHRAVRRHTVKHMDSGEELFRQIEQKYIAEVRKEMGLDKSIEGSSGLDEGIKSTIGVPTDIKKSVFERRQRGKITPNT